MRDAWTLLSPPPSQELGMKGKDLFGEKGSKDSGTIATEHNPGRLPP